MRRSRPTLPALITALCLCTADVLSASSSSAGPPPSSSTTTNGATSSSVPKTTSQPLVTHKAPLVHETKVYNTLPPSLNDRQQQQQQQQQSRKAEGSEAEDGEEGQQQKEQQEQLRQSRQLRTGGFGCYPSEKYIHTGCLIGSPLGCNVTSSGVTTKDKNFILKYHNQIRSMVASGSLPSARMMELHWDDELAYIAQKWANQCTFQNDCNECRSVPRFPVGQNVYGYVHWPDDGGASNWTTAMEFWLDAGKNFTDELIYEYQFQTPGGLYSQLIWGGTYMVGCGYAKFGTKSWQARHIYVCNYGPAGNMAGAPVYLPGQPCSHCPKGSTCIGGSLCRPKHAVAANLSPGDDGTSVIRDDDKVGRGESASGLAAGSPADYNDPPIPNPANNIMMPTTAHHMQKNFPGGKASGGLNAVTRTNNGHQPPISYTVRNNYLQDDHGPGQQLGPLSPNIRMKNDNNPSSGGGGKVVCAHSCVPVAFASMCDARTIIRDADCPPDRVCCAVAAVPQQRPIVQATNSQDPPIRIRKCEGTCVRVDQTDRCIPGTISKEPTTCGWGLVCCQLDPNKPLNDTTDPKNARQSASDGSSKIFQDSPPNGASTPAHRHEYCPQTHACLPISQWHLCDHKTVVSLAKNCSEASGRVCCQLADPAVAKAVRGNPVGAAGAVTDVESKAENDGAGLKPPPSDTKDIGPPSQAAMVGNIGRVINKTPYNPNSNAVVNI